MLKVTKQEGWKQSEEGITWFKYVYPKVKSSSWPEEYRPVCIQLHKNQYPLKDAVYLRLKSYKNQEKPFLYHLVGGMLS